jgi:hypothetical protein
MRIWSTLGVGAAHALLLIAACGLRPASTAAQQVSTPPQADTSKVETFQNTIAGEFTPARGFDIFRSDRGSLNISFYGLFRYVNQLPADQVFDDHLGGERAVKARNDLNWHRTMVWLTGFFHVPQLRYNITLWSLPTTQQTLLFGNLQYRFGRALTMGAGLLPNLTARSMQGSWPFWAGSDRQMAEDFFRGGFSSGVFMSGEAVRRLYYTVSVHTNLSQLGVAATNDTRDVSFGGSVFWLPTTGEFGPRGGFGDLEEHEDVATRFGISATHARESRYADDDAPPNATQIRLSDGINPFDQDALAQGVLVQTLDYDVVAFDAGFKHKGFSFQGEYYLRRLSNFKADGPLPVTDIMDHGFMAQAMHMVVPKKAGVYVSSGFVFDDFDRRPWELGGGVSVYPAGTRTLRLNLHVMHVNKSPASSVFGYYTAGLKGTILSIGTDILM